MRRTGPFFTDHGRTLLAAVLTIACALVFAAASAPSGDRATAVTTSAEAQNQ